MPSYSLVLDAGSPIDTPLGEIERLEIDGINPINIEPRHSAVGIWDVSTVVTDDEATTLELLATVKADTHIYVSDEHYDDESLAMRGVLHNTSYQEDTGQITLEGEGSGYYLMAGSGDVHYQNETVADAIADYWSRLDGFDATVHPPESQTIAEDVTVQSPETADDWEDLFSEFEYGDYAIGSGNLPIEFTDNGAELLQSCIVADLDGAEADDSYSGGEGETTSVASNFSFGYTLPEEYIGIALRLGIHDNPSTIEVHLENSLWGSFSLSNSTSPNWLDVSSASPVDYSGDFQDGDLYVTDEGDAGDVVVDLLVMYDKRFHDVSNFDNEVHIDGGYLDSPHLYAPFEIETNPTDAGQMIEWAGLTVDMADSDELEYQNDQRIQISFDGETWDPNDGSEDQTESVSAENDGVATTTVQSRIRLSDYSPGGVQSATPRYGYEGQAVVDWEMTVDLSSLGVIEDGRFEDDHLSNLQELHSRGDYRFTIIPSEQDPVGVESYQRGTQTREANWHTISRSRNRTTEDYWNKVTVKGPRDEEAGDRPVTMREDREEIERVGEVLEETIIRNDLETEADRSTVATQTLLEAVDAKEVTGKIEAAPTLILPGYRYYVEAWDAHVDLEELRFTDEYGGGNAVLDFDARAMLVDRLGRTQGELRREKR